MPPQDQKQAAIERMTDIAVQPTDAEILVLRRVGLPKLGRPEKPATIVSQKRDADHNQTGQSERIAGLAQFRRQTQRRRIAERGPPQSPDRPAEGRRIHYRLAGASARAEIAL